MWQLKMNVRCLYFSHFIFKDLYVLFTIMCVCVSVCMCIQVQVPMDPEASGSMELELQVVVNHLI